MLTPTGVTYAQYWSAIKAGNPTHVRFTFLGQNIVLDDTDVYLNSGVTVTDMFNGDTDLVFGRTLSKQITVTFLNSSKLNDLKWTGEFTLEFGVEIGSPATTYWVNMGYFTGEKPKNVTSVQTIQFTAYDRMGRFDILADEFVKSLTYPKTVSQIYDALCTYVGIQNVAGDELANIKSRSFSSAPADMQGYTCRDLLALIAEACGCYAKITSAGKVKLVWFTDNTAHAVTGTEEFSVESGDVNDGMTWDEADTFTWDEFDNFTWNDVCGYQEAMRIDRLYVKQLSSDMDINYPNDYGDMVYSIVDNPFLSVSTASHITSYLKPIYDRLYNFGGYLPVSLECVGNWCVEAGDIITIDVNNLTITFPIFVKEMRWSGAINDAYETTGTTNRQVYSSEASKQRSITSNKIEMYVTEAEDNMKNYTDGEVTDALNTVDQNYYKIRSGIAITVDGVTISGSKYINIESGSKIDIKNGADLDIESGGDINIKNGGNLKLESGGGLDIRTGASFTTQSGNFGVDSNGSPTLKGTAEIPNGKSLTVKSGGSADIESGGNMNIKSGGNVNIKSGGKVSVESGGNLDDSGSINVKSGGKIDIASGGDVDVNSGGDINLKSGGKLNLASGSDIEVASGGDINLASGGKLNLASGSDIEVASGGDINIASGGKTNVASGGSIENSGAINVKSGGKIDVKSGGDIDVQSGGDINVKSGGNFNIASGGNMNIHAAGTLELTGGTGSILMNSSGIDVTGGKYVKVQSGSSYMNIWGNSIDCHGASGSITSESGYVFAINGFDFSRTITGTNYRYNMSAYNSASSYYVFTMSADNTSLQLRSYSFMEFCPTNQTSYGLRLKKSGNYIVLYGSNGIKLGDHGDSTIGDINYIYGDYIYYNHLSQNSSREVKHNINPLGSVGEKLDGLKPVTFVYDYDKKEEQRMGLIYEDTIDIMPEICTNDESEKAINYVELIPALLKEIQELRIRVKTLEEREV